MTGKSRRLGWLVGALLMGLLVVPDLARYWIEHRQLRQLAADLTAGSITARQKALAISDKVRVRVQPVADGAFYHVKHRPGLRQTAWETWSHAEGQCGEGARLIVLLLRASGVSASRVYLFNSSTSFYHTAVVFEDNGELYLLDSISSPEPFHKWVRSEVPRLNDAVEYFSLPNGAYGYRTHNSFFDTFSFFNWSRILPGSRFEINQHLPMPSIIIEVMEFPWLAMALAKFLGLLLLLFTAHGVLRVASWLRSRSLHAPGRQVHQILPSPIQEL